MAGLHASAVAVMRKETLMRLFLALAMTVLFGAIIFRALWVVLAAFLARLAITAIWLWVDRETDVKL